MAYAIINIMSIRFQKKLEDFVCEHCATKVKGNGYTNHCPKCLWSKHVDVNPGDRLEACGGMMEPVALEKRKAGYILTHKCQKCGLERKNYSAENDEVDSLIKLSETLAKKVMF